MSSGKIMTHWLAEVAARPSLHRKTEGIILTGINLIVAAARWPDIFGLRRTIGTLHLKLNILNQVSLFLN
jgi:hypothetical protein